LIIHDIANMKEDFQDEIANYDFYKEVFGDLSKVEESDANPEVLYQRLKESGAKIPPIYMAIGTEDFLYKQNQIMRKFLEENKANFTYEEGPGIHDWKFWNAYLPKGIDWILKQI